MVALSIISAKTGASSGTVLLNGWQCTTCDVAVQDYEEHSYDEEIDIFIKTYHLSSDMASINIELLCTIATDLADEHPQRVIQNYLAYAERANPFICESELARTVSQCSYWLHQMHPSLFHTNNDLHITPVVKPTRPSSHHECKQQ